MIKKSRLNKKRKNHPNNLIVTMIFKLLFIYYFISIQYMIMEVYIVLTIIKNFKLLIFTECSVRSNLKNISYYGVSNKYISFQKS